MKADLARWIVTMLAALAGAGGGAALTAPPSDSLAEWRLARVERSVDALSARIASLETAVRAGRAGGEP